MTAPSWDDPKLGTMDAGGLWLIQVIGKGNIFTKAQIRDAFPNIAQADRRIRDLRTWGWVILSSKEDATLTLDQQRFVESGVPTWDKEARRQAKREKPITAKEREATLSRDDYLCTVCGISGGEAYPDSPAHTAVLVVSRRPVATADGIESMLLVTECKICRSGLGSQVRDISKALEAFRALDNDDRTRLAQWVKAGRRDLTAAEKAWAQYMRLPTAAREELRSLLTGGHDAVVAD